MNTTELVRPAARQRRKHSAEFKAQVIAACLKPGVSIAAVALANGLNANFLRSWVKAHRDQQRAAEPATRSADPRREGPADVSIPTLIPVAVQPADVAPLGDIQIEIRHQQTVLQIAWPASQASVCAQWLREVLR
jgi:transposase